MIYPDEIIFLVVVSGVGVMNLAGAVSGGNNITEVLRNG
jgi:hypothetical protein